MVKSKKKKNQQNNGYCQDYRWGPGGNMPPWMGGPCPDDKWGPRWMGGPCPDDMWGPGEDMPPWMGGPCPDDMWGPRRDMPPWTEGPCPDDMRGLGGNMPPWMRDPCLDETGGPGGDMPPWTEGPCPDDMRGPGRNIPPWMRDPCLDETGGPGGDMPPWTGGPCPDDTGGPGGNMSPWMRDPCPDDMWQLRKRRKYMQPNMRGPCPNMGDPRENMYPGPNAPDQRQCRTFGGPGKYLSGKEQPMENGRENGPSPPGNCSSDQPASLNLFDKNNFKKRKDQPTSRNAAESAANTQKHYRMLTEEGAARILSNFGLSTEDLVEFGHYSDDQLKPENMAMILRDIVERKKARQLPTSSQGKEEETSGRHGGSDSLMKTGPVLPSATQPTTTPAASFMPQSSVSPSPSMMKDYHAVSPTILPHVCSLCKIECANMTDWNLHVGTTAHSEKCAQLRQQHPDWNPEDCSLLQRHEGDKKEKHIAMPCSTSSNSNASQHSVPGHASSQTRSRSRSPDPHSRKRSRSRSSERSRRKRSRSRSSERSRRKRSRSRSSERSRRKQLQSRIPRCRSKSSERPSSSSQSSSIQKRELGRSTRSPASSAEAGSSRQPPAKSDVAEQPPNTSDAQKVKRLPTLSMINDYYAASPKIFPHVCSLCNVECRHLKDWNLHVGTTAHSEKRVQLRQQHPDWNPEDCSLLQRDEGDKKEKHIAMPCSTSSNLNASQHSVPGHASSQTRSQSRSPGPHSRKRSRSRSSERSRRKRSRSRSSERSRRKRSRSRSSERSRRKRSRSRSSERSRRKRSRSRSSERSRRKRSRSRSSERSRRKRSRSRSSERSRRKRSRSRSSERSRRIQSQYRSSQHCRRTQSQSRSSEGCRTQLRSRIPRCRSSERPSSSSQSSSIQRRELGRSTRSPASSAKAGSSRQPPAKPDVGEQPPNKSEHPLQTNPGHQKLPKKEGATLEQGDRQPPAKSGVGEQPPNKSEHPLQTNPDHQKLPKKEAATQEQGDQQREDLLHLVLTPLAEQSVMQALSVLQSGGVVGAGLAQGTSLPPLPPVQIDPASLSLVSMMQLVATQVVEAALASKETSSVQGRPSVAGSPQLSIPAESEEKKQEGSQEVVPGFVPSCSGLAAVRIWIVGHSIVHWASLRAMESGLGRHLGLPNYVSVSWMSRCGMRWDEFLPMVKAKVSCEGPPAAMVVQLGENDLALVHSFSLRLRMQNDLEELAAAHPGLKIFWSEFLQRRVWLGSRCPTAIERSRKRVDHAVGKKVVALGGSVIHHAGITLKDAGLYRPDGVNLSNAGNDVWLSNVSVELMGWLQMCWLQV
ncbi:serine/arginine repetitive matrix protein 2 isoform X10 [Zootoca vivipara]|uniref:serine/arginine repetitive matrix protein 2 isoform X10 n=1 Tax=Zootoca vivipara TaxID=8524 RepID=UPI00293B9798|nr:serine/arginine repetitive matrix protein 2 isoform X10 [Zootoca vivipara]